MTYRIIVIETIGSPDRDVDTYLYGKFKYKEARDAEADAKAIKTALSIVGINVKTKIESQRS
jgi:hypothetical protein